MVYRPQWNEAQNNFQLNSELLIIETIIGHGDGTDIVEIVLSHFSQRNQIVAINGDYEVPPDAYILGIRQAEDNNKISVRYNRNISGNVRVNVVYKPIK